MNEKHFHRLMGLMDSGRVVCGGTGSAETLQIAPTVLADVSPDSPVMSEEIFGPVLPVLAYESLDLSLIHIYISKMEWAQPSTPSEPKITPGRLRTRSAPFRDVMLSLV